MYQVSIFNVGVETVIHTPNPSNDAPHILGSSFKETLSLAEQLTLSIPFGNPGYSLVQGLITKVKVMDTRDNSIIFSGRVVPTMDGMGSDGKFINQIACEGALNYLNDTQTRRWDFINQTPRQILQFLLDQHDSKMDSSRRIYLGTVEITQPITISTNFETTLNTVLAKVKNVLGGDIRVQERAGLLYLDYLVALGVNNEVILNIGTNLKQMIREYDPTEVVTRVIPLGYGEGINQLDITGVNSTEYIEDAVAIGLYGVIEGIATNKDIQNADTLKIYGQTVLAEKKQPKLTLDTAMIDRSVLAEYAMEKYSLGDTLHTLVDIMNIDVYARVIERTRDIINSPWDPTLAISTRPITLTDQIVDLKQRNQTLENAPQGNTCIFPINKAENADATHPITLDLDIPKEAININKVYLHLHGQKYRAYEKSVIGGSSSADTTDSSSKETSEENLDHEHVLFCKVSTGTVYTPDDFSWSPYFVNGGGDPWEAACMLLSDPFDGTAPENITTYGATGKHAHGMKHTHGMEHTHENTIGYGIFESTYPKNVKISVNGTDIGVNFGDGSVAFDEYNIDITSRVNTGNNKISISTEQNGRIDAIVYSQIFIQSK